MGDVLSAREESAGLGHLVSVFALGAQGPCQGCDAEDDSHEDGSVGFPVGGLRVPATGGRPDVLGVSSSTLGLGWNMRRVFQLSYGTRGPPP